VDKVDAIKEMLDNIKCCTQFNCTMRFHFMRSRVTHEAKTVEDALLNFGNKI